MSLNPSGNVLADIERGEAAIPLTELAGQPFVPKAHGKSPHVSAVFRWAKRGLRGHKLATARAGGRLVTTKSAVIRFFAQLSSGSDAGQTRTPGQRQRAIDRVEHQLEAAGL